MDVAMSKMWGFGVLPREDYCCWGGRRRRRSIVFARVRVFCVFLFLLLFWRYLRGYS